MTLDAKVLTRWCLLRAATGCGDRKTTDLLRLVAAALVEGKGARAARLLDGTPPGNAILRESERLAEQHARTLASQAATLTMQSHRETTHA